MNPYYSSYNRRSDMGQPTDPNQTQFSSHSSAPHVSGPAGERVPPPPPPPSTTTTTTTMGGGVTGGGQPPALSTPPPNGRSETEIAAWLSANQITIYGDRVPQPMLAFSDLTAPSSFHLFFAEMKFSSPTLIQSMAWPAILNKRDLVAIARTGSGKTMGFMVPALLHVLSQPSPVGYQNTPLVLVLAPTRELACQIEEESLKLIRRVPGIYACCVYGGVPKGGQCRQLRGGPQIVVGTPGRLIDLADMKATSFARVSYLVLDEADRMLDMGFEPQITKIVDQIPRGRQTLMFSATWPKEVRSLAARYQQDFVRIHVGSEDLTANKDIQQHIVVANSEREKVMRLMEVLIEIGWQRALIFTKTKRAADQLHLMLLNGLNGQGSPSSPTTPTSSYYPTRRPVLVIHGNKLQATRDEVLARFRQEHGAVLVATDVAARGLDISDLDVVINFELPTNIEDYVHRIGRTGRAGKKGDAYSIVCNSDPPKLLGDIANLMIQNGQEVGPEMLALCEFRRSGGGDGRSGWNYSSRGGGYYGGGGSRGGRGWGGRGGGGGGDFMGRSRGRGGTNRGTGSYAYPQSSFTPYPNAYGGAGGGREWNAGGYYGNAGGGFAAYDRGGMGGGNGGGGGYNSSTPANPYISPPLSFPPGGGGGADRHSRSSGGGAPAPPSPQS